MSRPVLVGWALGVAAALLLAACTGDPAPSPSATQSVRVKPPDPYVNPVREAVADLAWAPAVRYKGSVNDPLRRPVEIDFTMTIEGSGSGTFKVAGQSGQLLAIDGAVYLRAGAAFWRMFPRVLEEGVKAEQDLRAKDGEGYIDDLVRTTVNGMAGGVTSHWTKADPADLGLVDPRTLAPQAIASSAGFDLAEVNPATAGVATTVGRTAATKLSAGSGTTGMAYYVRRSAPYRLLRVEATSGAAGLRLDITRLSAEAAQQARDDIAFQVGSLDTALDLQIELAYIPKRTISISCSRSGGCRSTAKLTTTGKLAPLAGGTMIVVAVGPGGYLGTCLSPFGGFGFGRTKQVACTINTPALRKWYSSTTDKAWFNSVLLPNRGLGTAALEAIRQRLANPSTATDPAVGDAATVWEQATGASATGGGCGIYQRIPGEWTRVLGSGDPLAPANLIAMRPEEYRSRVEAGWSVRRTFLFGRQPAAAEVERWARDLDRLHGAKMQVAAKGVVPTCD